jgi:hypothetical protein
VAFAIIHLATGRYRGFTRAHDVVIGTFLATIWMASALIATVQRPRQGFFVMLAGVGATLVHGVMFSVATTGRTSGPHGAGIPFLVGGLLQAYLVVHAAPAFFAPEEVRPAAEAAPAGRRFWSPLRARHSH